MEVKRPRGQHLAIGSLFRCHLRFVKIRASYSVFRYHGDCHSLNPEQGLDNHDRHQRVFELYLDPALSVTAALISKTGQENSSLTLHSQGKCPSSLFHMAGIVYHMYNPCSTIINLDPILHNSHQSSITSSFISSIFSGAFLASPTFSPRLGISSSTRWTYTCRRFFPTISESIRR